MKELLRAPHVEIEACEEASDILPAMERFQPELVLLDYWLGDTKVDTVIEQIRAKPSFQNVKLILVSAIDNLEEVAAELNVDKVIKKPFDIFEFQTQVNNLLTEYEPSSSN